MKRPPFFFLTLIFSLLLTASSYTIFAAEGPSEMEALSITCETLLEQMKTTATESVDPRVLEILEVLHRRIKQLEERAPFLSETVEPSAPNSSNNRTELFDSLLTSTQVDYTGKPTRGVLFRDSSRDGAGEVFPCVEKLRQIYGVSIQQIATASIQLGVSLLQQDTSTQEKENLVVDIRRMKETSLTRGIRRTYTAKKYVYTEKIINIPSELHSVAEPLVKSMFGLQSLNIFGLSSMRLVCTLHGLL